MQLPKNRSFLAAFASFMLAIVLSVAFLPAMAVASDVPAEDQEQIVTEPVPDEAETNDTELVNDDNPAPSEANPAGQVQEGDAEADALAAQGEGEQEAPEQPAEDASVEAEAYPADPVHVLYSTHVQKKSWMPYETDGAMAGTQGQSLRMEAMKIKLDLGKSGLTGGIEYRVHAQTYGWLGWVSNDALGGTSGESKRLEAIQIRLTGAVAEKYDVYYCVHAQKRGWMAWAKNGETAGTAGQSLRLEAIKIVLVDKNGGTAPSSDFVTYGKPFDNNSYFKLKAHVQSYGWRNGVSNGEVAGVTGQSKRLEAIQLTGLGLDCPGTVMIDGHVQSYGWMGYKKCYAGTTGKGKRLEAIRMKLTDEAASKYNIYYRVHAAHLGWLNWAKNGEEAGTAGMSCRTEAVQVYIAPVGDPAPSSSGSATSEAYVSGTNIAYNAYCQSYGWRGETWNGGSAGTLGESKRLEAFTARLSGGNIGGGVSYKAYVAGSGWQGAKSDNSVAGTTGQSQAVEAIQMSLTGRAAKMYDIYYRTHTQKAGWLGWAKNGQTAGAPGTGKRVEAMQVKLVPKGAAAPGSTTNHEVGKSYFDDPMVRKAQGYSSPTGWLILVDDKWCNLGVFRGSQGNWQLYNKWIVSTGNWDSRSVHGVFSVSGRGYSFGHGYTCYYWVSWNGPYLFHSVKYHEGTFNILDGTLGHHISGGCVRMWIDKAKWIHDNIPDGTTVVVYE